MTHTLPHRAVGHSGYKGGCRCDGCVAGHKAHMAAYRGTPEFKARAKEHNAKWRREHEKEYFKTARATDSPYMVRRRARQQAFRDWIASIKVASGCVDCGFNLHSDALQFDHVRGEKLFELSKAEGRSQESVVAEIAKCEVVCGNCHHIRSHARKDGNRLGSLIDNLKLRSITENLLATVPVGRKAHDFGEWLAVIKLRSGCTDCGYSEHPVALEFDHVRGEKKYLISRLCGRRQQLILEEIAKCDVRCCNCHHIATSERRLAVA